MSAARDLVERVVLEVARGQLDAHELLVELGWEDVAVSFTGHVHAVDEHGRPRCGLRRFRRAWMASAPTCRTCRRIGGVS